MLAGGTQRAAIRPMLEALSKRLIRQANRLWTSLPRLLKKAWIGVADTSSPAALCLRDRDLYAILMRHADFQHGPLTAAAAILR